MDHQAKNSHHCGTSIVQLNSTLGKLGLLIEGIPSKVKSTITEVTNELSGGSTVGTVLHDAKLQGTNEGNNLSKTGAGDGIGSGDGSPSIGEGVEGVAGVVNVARKVDAIAGDNLSQEGKLGDTSVLDLDISETVEALLVGTIEHAKGVEEAKRSLGTELVLEGGEGGGGLATLGGGEGSGRAGKSSDGDKFHHFEVGSG
ncbi:hypothetical protein ACHAXH_005689 [Discostella pseudostelligera]